MYALLVTIIYQPIFNLLIALYDVIPLHDMGLAIIGLTVLIRLILWPLSAKAMKSQKALTDLQPKVEALKAEYKGKSQEEMGKAMMALYSAEKVSPFSSCLPLVVQLIVLIPLYRALAAGLKSDGFNLLYSFVANPGTVNPKFIGLVDLAVPSIALAILAGITSYFQARMMVAKKQPKVAGAKDEQMMAMLNKQMLYLMPALMVFISWRLPGGLSLYIVTTNLVSILQQWLYLRKPRTGGAGTPASPIVTPAAKA